MTTIPIISECSSTSQSYLAWSPGTNDGVSVLAPAISVSVGCESLCTCTYVYAPVHMYIVAKMYLRMCVFMYVYCKDIHMCVFMYVFIL